MKMRTIGSELRNAVIAAAVTCMLAIPARSVPAQDTTRVNVSDGRGLVLKPHVGVKGFGRLYEGGKAAGIGLGVEAGLDAGKVSAGGSFSAVKADAVRVEESSVWVSAPLGKVDVTGYAYTDLFFQAPTLTYGANASGYGVKVGAEIAPYSGADGFWGAYLKVPCGSVTPGISVVGWGNDGWKGGPEKVALSLATQHKIAEKLKLATETSYGKMISGGDGSLQFRVTVSYSPF